MNKIEKDIYKLVSNDKLNEALVLLEKNSLYDKKQISILKGNLSSLNKKERLNLINFQELEIEKNKIRYSILDLVLTPEIKKKNRSNHIEKYVFILLVITFAFCYKYLGLKRESASNNELKYKMTIFKFNSYNITDSLRIENAIFDRIQSISIENDLSIRIIINKAINTEEIPLSFYKADSIVTKTKTNLVLWGNYEVPKNTNSTLINIKYLSSGIYKEDKYEKTKGETGIKEIKTISVLAQGELTGTIENIILWALGIKAFAERNYKKSISIFKTMTPENSNQQSLIYQAISEVYLESGNLQLAKKNLQKSLEIKPNDEITLYNMTIIENTDLKDKSDENIVNSNDSLIIPNLGVLGISIGFTPIEIKEILGKPNEVREFDDCSFNYFDLGISTQEVKEFDDCSFLNYFDLGISVRIENNHCVAIFLYGEDRTDVRFKPYRGATSEGVTTFSSRQLIERVYGKPNRSLLGIMNYSISYDNGIIFTFNTKDINDYSAKIEYISILKKED